MPSAERPSLQIKVRSNAILPRMLRLFFAAVMLCDGNALDWLSIRGIACRSTACDARHA